MLESFDFDAAVHAPFRMQPGLRRVRDGAPQLTPLAPGSRHQREKLAVLFALRDEAMLAAPGFDPEPALDALCTQAQAEHPGHFTFDGTRAIAPRLGVGVDAQSDVIAAKAGAFGLGDELPRCLESLPREWRRAGLLALAFAEDIAIVDGDTARIPWLCVALPSRWAPREKVGRHFAEVHAPVADSATLLVAGEHLMRLVCKSDRWERFVWNVTDHPRLNAHPRTIDHEAAWVGVDGLSALPGAAWFRSERQSFVPLPEHRQAAFLIGVDVVPLAAVIDRPERAQRLHDAIESMSPAVLAYRGLAVVRGPLLAWLDERARA
jgi:dimethylamine monooxygenase subunit A